jgi:VWFA-related protein
MKITFRLIILMIILSFCVFLQAPLQGFASDQVILRLNRVDSNLYPTNFLNVCLIGPDGKPIENLKPDNFQVIEDGKEQKVLDVAQSGDKGAAISVVLVIDTSGSMHGAMEDMKTAAKSFVRNLSTGDKIAIVSFSDFSTVDCDFTDDRKLLETAIDGLKPSGSTALYTTVVESAKLFENVKEGNKAIVVMTDGMNNRGGAIDACVKSGLEKGVPIFTIGLGNVDKMSLEFLATETGGMFRYAPTSSELEEIYKSLANQLKKQLWIKYEANPQRWPKTKVNTIIKLKGIPGAGMTSSLNYIVPLQWWKVITIYVLIEVVLVVLCYLLFNVFWKKMNMDPVSATRFAIFILIALTTVWYTVMFILFVPITYFLLIGLAQLILLSIPIKLMAK